MGIHPVSFLTPYWSGSEMMRIHLASLRRFHPDAPILVSTRGGDQGEMEAWRREFGIEYWLEECGYTDAYLRLLLRCRTRYACILDHDTVLLAGLDGLLAGLAGGHFDLAGIEERIRLPEHLAGEGWPASNGWLRFAPGCTASNFLLFDWRQFESRWGLRGILGRRPEGARHFDFDYGIGQRLARHHYLQPFHIPKYGIGNLLKDGETPVLWHQWYGSYRTRLAAGVAAHAILEAGERAFIDDYPDLGLGDQVPAWGPRCDVAAEQIAIAASQPAGARIARAAGRLRLWASIGLRSLAARVAVRMTRGGG